MLLYRITKIDNHNDIQGCVFYAISCFRVMFDEFCPFFLLHVDENLIDDVMMAKICLVVDYYFSIAFGEVFTLLRI